MNETMRDWWRTRTLREQRLLLAMFGLSAVVLAWLLVIRPLNDALSRARERHGEAVLQLAEARAQVRTVAGLEQSAAPPLTAPLDTLLNQSATEAGFPVARVDREGVNQATLVVPAVRPQAFFGWVGQMEARERLIVERLTATTNSDQTLSVTVTFRARGG
ncbi:MAG TPA: type II secretion system protein GspM [Allosphingosinicella sp.]|jgi:general secretion pathway protein M